MCLRSNAAETDPIGLGHSPPVEEEKAANIRAVAKWADLEEDATWYTRVGGVLLEAGHYGRPVTNSKQQ